MSHIGPYWRGVTQRLQAEVEQMNQLIDHQGAKGTENELSLARLVENLVPTRYGVGSGLLVDAVGNSSKQMDLVVYDRGDQPGIFSQTNQVLFPIENVRLCVEVKTQITQSELDDGRAKKSSIQKLAPSTGIYPPLALFGYGASLGAKTISDHLDSPTTQAGERPDFTLVVKLGLLVGNLPGTTQWTRAVTHLHRRDASGQPISGSIDQPNDKDSVSVNRSGVNYPLVKVDNDYLPAEPSRALLLFAEWIVSSLQTSGNSPVISAYIDPISRELTDV